MPANSVEGGTTANGTSTDGEPSAYGRAAETGAAAHRARRAGFRLTPKRIALILVGFVVFLVLSGLLARFLQTENVERDDDLALIEAEVKGDVPGMLDKLAGCRQSAACVASVRANAVNPRLLRTGAVKILQLKSATAYSIAGATGKTRLAWTVIGKLPVVQCIGVRRSGNFVSGVKVTLTSLSAPIPNEADC
jgi:hypothetical protein